MKELIEVRISHLEKLKCPRVLLDKLGKEGMLISHGRLSEWSLFDLWVAVSKRLHKYPFRMKILSGFSESSYAVHIESTDGLQLVYRHSRTIKTAFGQAIVAYVKLCIQ